MNTLCGKPLTFGDPDQIAELRRRERAAEEAKKLKKYVVTVEWSGYEEVEVEAHSEEEAKEIANDRVDFSNLDDVSMSAKLK